MNQIRVEAIYQYLLSTVQKIAKDRIAEADANPNKHYEIFVSYPDEGGTESLASFNGMGSIAGYGFDSDDVDEKYKLGLNHWYWGGGVIAGYELQNGLTFLKVNRSGTHFCLVIDMIISLLNFSKGKSVTNS